MTALLYTLAILQGLGVVYQILQVSEGKHIHMENPTSNAIAALIHLALLGIILYALFNWA